MRSALVSGPAWGIAATTAAMAKMERTAVNFIARRGWRTEARIDVEFLDLRTDLTCTL